MHPILQIRDCLPDKLRHLIVREDREPVLWIGQTDFRYSQDCGWEASVHLNDDYLKCDEYEVARSVSCAFVGWGLAPQDWFASHHADIMNRFACQNMFDQKSQRGAADMLQFTGEHEGFLSAGSLSFTVTGFDPRQQVTLDQASGKVTQTIGGAVCLVPGEPWHWDEHAKSENNFAPLAAIPVLFDIMRRSNKHTIYPLMHETLALPQPEDDLSRGKELEFASGLQ